jgi:acyl carrier protein
MAEFIVSVEEAFGIDIPDADFDGLLTVGDLIAYVKRKGGLDGTRLAN